MTDVVVAELALPEFSGTPRPSWACEQAHALTRAVCRELLDSEDFVDGLPALLASYARQDDELKVELYAVEGVDAESLPRGRFGLPELSPDAGSAGAPGRVVGVASSWMGLRDNRHLAGVVVEVAADRRDRGIGSALLAAVERIARAQGRSTLMGWYTDASPAAGEPTLVPPTGDGALARDRLGTRFALAHGFRLEQCERYSELPLPVAEEVLAPLVEDARGRSAGYRLVTWEDAVPDELVDSYCDLLRHFSTEMPLGELDVEEEAWDVARVRRQEAETRATGRRTVSTGAIHEQTGQLVALTTLLRSELEHPDRAQQLVTVVDRDHRGHRLGWLVKAENLRQLERVDPERRRVTTWNAGENAWMLAINEALGYREKAVGGAWQKRLDGAAPARAQDS